jgi:hypothetical protein
MSDRKKKSSGRGGKGNREPGLTPPIPLVPAKVDESDEPLMKDITIKKNPLKKATKDNTKKKQFSAIETFTGNGAFIVIILKKLPREIFERLDITNFNKKVDERLDYLLQVTTSCAQDQLLVNIFKQGRWQFANAFFVISEHQKDAFSQDQKAFFEWLVKEDKEDIPEETQVNLGKQDCQWALPAVWSVDLLAAEAVETGRIPKKDKKRQRDASEKGGSKKADIDALRQ